MPVVAEVAGEPEMVGAWLASVTVIENAGSDALARPSVTAMTMFEWVTRVVGVPESSPVRLSKLAHDGLFCTLKPSVSPSSSAAVGRKT